MNQKYSVTYTVHSVSTFKLVTRNEIVNYEELQDVHKRAYQILRIEKL